MRRIHFAESILSLVTSQERAASTAGDLAEEAEVRGSTWFWWNVLGAVTSLLWRDITETPARMTGLALRGLAVFVVQDCLHAFLTGVAFFAVPFLSGHPMQWNFIGWQIWLNGPEFFFALLIGRMLARWAPGHELASCLASVIIASIFSMIISLVYSPDIYFSALLWQMMIETVQYTPMLLAGALWGRHKRLTRQTHQPA